MLRLILLIIYISFYANARRDNPPDHGIGYTSKRGLCPHAHASPTHHHHPGRGLVVRSGRRRPGG
ncbi:protein of unknown function [Magnetospirillum gryphiswaldense MSR-1 v2]|uniref:Secreted protein n=1 Tax=Magnetospirillum gryphiswaldense (strain DSM 6361 / JCM 21280 / NBRC 15271 / MSR-1) TaxID=431944 RepID=V6EX68_MAGGM|nr:protein of unknown function [Magnetospirillum gryphiswaldense MSR-1 v2]